MVSTRNLGNAFTSFNVSKHTQYKVEYSVRIVWFYKSYSRDGKLSSNSACPSPVNSPGHHLWGGEGVAKIAAATIGTVAAGTALCGMATQGCRAALLCLCLLVFLIVHLSLSLSLSKVTGLNLGGTKHLGMQLISVRFVWQRNQAFYLCYLSLSQRL